MEKESTELLKECNSGCKNATSSMEQILPYVKNEKLKKLIECYNKKHIEIGEECKKILFSEGKEDKDPDKLTKAFSWFGTEIKLLIDADSDKVSEMLVDGCAMGIKSVSHYINTSKTADTEIKNLAMELIDIEQDFMNELLEFL